ncbi:MAG: endonuclease/exonuclease/phosphatase family protein [Myxococcota bacterium]|nr:endonuclease/exonuclease/phosphatase family protein [Myxococcota bacterium]
MTSPSTLVAVVTIVAATLATGCYGVDELTGTWEPIDSIGEPLIAEHGPGPLASGAPERLRIGSFNVHYARQPEALARQLLASRAMSRVDVLLLQEIEAYPEEPTSRTRRLADALSMTSLYVPARTVGTGTHGLAILSRHPVSNARVMQLPHADAAWHERDRIAVAVDVEVGGRSLTIVNLHLDVRISVIDRIRELHPAVIDLPGTAVIGGDFNTNPWAWVGSAVPLTSTKAIVGQDQAVVVDDYLGALGFTSPISPGQDTFNVPWIGGRLDNIYPRGLAVHGAGVATDVAGSDHWPIWVDVTIP